MSEMPQMTANTTRETTSSLSLASQGPPEPERQMRHTMITKSQTATARGKCHLLAIPVEIRVMIYGYLTEPDFIGTPTTLNFRQSHERPIFSRGSRKRRFRLYTHPILSTCKQIFLEATPMMKATRSSTDTIGCFWKSKRSLLSSLREITLEFRADLTDVHAFQLFWIMTFLDDREEFFPNLKWVTWVEHKHWKDNGAHYETKTLRIKPEAVAEAAHNAQMTHFKARW